MRAGIPPSFSVFLCGGKRGRWATEGVTSVRVPQSGKIFFSTAEVRWGSQICLFHKQCGMIGRRRSAVWPPSAAEISDLAPLAAPLTLSQAAPKVKDSGNFFNILFFFPPTSSPFSILNQLFSICVKIHTVKVMHIYYVFLYFIDQKAFSLTNSSLLKDKALGIAAFYLCTT